MLAKPSEKILSIKIIRDHLDLGLKEAKELVENSHPVMLNSGQVEKINNALVNIGLLSKLGVRLA